ncbi:unnamed protein product [Caenorhabditis nigoni]
MLSTNPDAERKLSYDCLKCVIQKLEVNFRFRLAKRLPKIRLAEKAAPLYISALYISEEGFELNATKYQLGVIRHARDGPNPEAIIDENRRGGSPRDFDRFGFWDNSLQELTPGDILIQDFDPQMYGDDDLESEEAEVVATKNRLTALELEKMELENALEMLENEPEHPGKIESEEEVLVEIGHEENNHLLDLVEELLEETNDDIRHEKSILESAELTLQCYRCKRDNRPSPLDMFIQLTMTSSDGAVYTERFNYDKTLHEARKYLITKFLGNRQLPTKIKSLRFWGWMRVVCLPEGIKLDVQEFGTSGNLSKVLQQVETILEHPNRPFASLESDGLTLEDAQNPKVRNAGVLWLFRIFALDYVALCREVPNKRIQIVLARDLMPEEYAMIVENLIDTKGTLGTCYEISEMKKKTARTALKVIAERFENSLLRSRLVTIPLPNQLQLDVSYASRQFNSSLLRYKIRMEVVQRRTN